ncbi:MAG: UDP-N-acetylmuramate dehydrogenase [Bacteroidaceae bacterium]
MFENTSLLPYNTFGIDVRTRILVSYDNVGELRSALQFYRTSFSDKPLLHIGSGSNLLFLKDFPGMILRSHIVGVELLGTDGDEVVVRVGAGVEHDEWVSMAIRNGWYGLENLSLIPGQVGSSAVQNIGAYGVEVRDVIENVEGVNLLTGDMCIWNRAQCQYGYRTSVFKTELRGQYAITHVTFRLHRTFCPHIDYGALRTTLLSRSVVPDEVTPEQLRQVIIDVRRDKLPDPKIQGNAGSFFMNPVISTDEWEKLRRAYPQAPHYEVDASHVKVPAGWLIEQAGWKGRILGKAAVHDRQALVLVNRGGATGADILALCEAVRQDVRTLFGIDLQPEVNFIGS